MYKHAEKLELYFQSKTSWFRPYYYKIYQMSYQLLLSIIIGSVAFGKGGNCSVPVQVFLSGLFSMYIFALILNFFMFLVRFLKSRWRYSLQMKRLSLRMDLCYFPLYMGFSIVEFCWYIVGAEWISEQNNCMDEYPDGLRLAQALVVLWVLTMAGIIAAFGVVNCYLCCRRYSGAQTLGPDIVVNCPINDIRSYPESPAKIINTVSHTPARQGDD